MFESVQRSGEVIHDADEHADELESAMRDAERAGDKELAGLLRNRAKMVRAGVRSMGGRVTIQRRDGTRFALADVRQNIRRSGRPAGTISRSSSPTVAAMNRMSAELQRVGCAADLARINAVLNAPDRSRQTASHNDTRPLTGWDQFEAEREMARAAGDPFDD